MTNFNLRGISFKSYSPDREQFPADFLDEVYEVGTTAFRTELQRSPEEIDFVMGGRSIFAGRLANPAIGMADGHLLSDQSFANPSLSVAFLSSGNKVGNIIGWSYSADNVSGSSEAIRQAKQLSMVKNYRWLKIVVVLQDFQHRGIGTALSAIQLAKAGRMQPSSAYTWPTQGNAAGTKLVESLGMTPTGTRPRKIYGTDEEIDQRRYEARLARGVVKRVISRGLPEGMIAG